MSITRPSSINMPSLIGRLAHWMLLLQEFNFQIYYRLRVQHAIADYLSRLESGEPTDSTHDDLPDVGLFNVTTTLTPNEHEDEWITKMTHFLSTGLPPDHLILNARKRLAVMSQNFCLVSDTLYHKGSDGIWRCAIRQFEKYTILQEAHHGIAGGHYTGESTTRKVWQSGLWWPTTKKDAHEFCRQWDLCERMGQPTKQA